MDNPVIAIRVQEREDSGLFRADLVYESGSVAHGYAANLDEVYSIAMDHGVNKDDITFHGESLAQLRSIHNPTAWSERMDDTGTPFGTIHWGLVGEGPLCNKDVGMHVTDVNMDEAIATGTKAGYSVYPCATCGDEYDAHYGPA